jgi:hypothetical protein
MTQDALASGAAGHNVCVEGRTVRADLRAPSTAMMRLFVLPARSRFPLFTNAGAVVSRSRSLYDSVVAGVPPSPVPG